MRSPVAVWRLLRAELARALATHDDALVWVRVLRNPKATGAELAKLTRLPDRRLYPALERLKADGRLTCEVAPATDLWQRRWTVTDDHAEVPHG